jgi:hypothetical protein
VLFGFFTTSNLRFLAMIFSKRTKRVIKSSVTLAVFSAAAAFAAAPTVTLRGKAQSCYPGLPVRLVGVSGVEVSAYRVSRVPSLTTHLNAFDSTGRASASMTGALMMRLDTLLTKADSIAKRSKRLAHAVSDSLGNFNLRIPVTDSVLIYATWKDEDDTFPEAHMTMSGRTSRAFVLDMAHGGCTPGPTR